jgi:hypothetical protein
VSRVTSVPNRPKFLPQNTKVAGKKYGRQKKTAADSAPKLGQKGQKSGRKKMLETNACLFDKKAKEDANFSLRKDGTFFFSK